MTSIAKHLAEEAQGSIDFHKEVIQDLERLVRIAHLGVSNEEISCALLDINEGNWEETFKYIQGLEKSITGILTCWLVGARLEWFERKGQTK